MKDEKLTAGLIHDQKVLVKHESPHNNGFVDLEKDDVAEDNRNPIYRQILAVSPPILNTICAGLVSGFSAILLPQMRDASSTIKATLEEESWIASMPPLFMGFGCLLGGWTMEQFGRKKSMLISCMFIFVGWIIIYFTTTVDTLLIGRLLCGLALGVSGPSISAYIAEVSIPKYRGLFLSLIALGISVGLLLSHLWGTFLSWRVTALLSIAPSIASLVVLFCVPESHVWYINRNKVVEAKSAFFWFRGRNQDAKDELGKLLQQQRTSTSRLTLGQRLSECLSARFMKPFAICVVFFCTMQMCGTNAVVFYSVSMMKSTVPGLNEYAAMLIVDTLRLAVSILACVLTKRYRVRPLTMISCTGTFASLFIIALFVHFSQIYTHGFFVVAPMVPLMLYIVLTSIGLTVIPWSLCGEILPPSSKGIGVGISTFVNFMAFFTVVKTSPLLFDIAGAVGGFSLYGAVTVAGTICLYFVLPETKNKTLQDIEDYFAGRRRCSRTSKL